MGIDAKETSAILWKILECWMNTSIKFMRNHPILSGVSMFLLTLYIFLPSLLFFLIYSSPVLACAVVYVREKMGLRFSASHKPLSSSGEKSCGGEKNGVKCHLRQQRSVRRNARMKVEEWDSQTSEEEKDKVILTSLYNDLLGRTPQFEESPKAIETDVVEEKEIAIETDEKPTICNCEINEEKYGELDGHEETREEMSNVNEYGISEIERNKRLESLIARRRARRLFKLALDQRNKLQAEETISPRQNNNLQITVPKNILEKHRNYSPDNNTVTGLQMPGSAPSVLSQGRNPFDIPYDPQEERPNLTGDSFDEEFSLFNQKDMFFCRHESFCRFALFSSEPSQCLNSPASASDLLSTRRPLDLDNEYIDHMEQKLHYDGKIEDEGRNVKSVKNQEKEVEMNEETDSNKEEGGDDSSCSDESESELNRLNKAELREAICHSMDHYPGFLVNQARNSIPSPLPKAVVAPRLDDNNMFYTRRCASSHTRTYSVASDMQVEVSEIGSPPTTVDWLDEWSNGGENYMYDTDIDREIIRDEESRMRLSHQYESSSGIGPKEENNGIETKPMAKTDQTLFDRKSQTEEDVAEEIFEQRPCKSSDVLERTNSGKFGGLIFHTSVSLSSITEEPETILDSIDGDISENMNCFTEEGTDQRYLPPLDSSMIDEEAVDAKQLGNGDLCGSPIHSFKREMEEEEVNLGNEALQSDLKSRELLESKVMEENGLELVENSDEKEEPIEQETTQIFFKGSSSHPHTQLVEDYKNVENPENMIFMQVHKGNSSTSGQEISQEAHKSGCVELTQECNNGTNAEEEPVVSANIQNSQPWTQQCDINSSERISPRTMEITEQANHEEDIVSQDITKDESAAVAQGTTGSENNDEEDMKLNDQVGEAMEKKLELNLESVHHNIGLVTKEDDEESEKRIEAMHVTDTETTKDDNRVLDQKMVIYL